MMICPQYKPKPIPFWTRFRLFFCKTYFYKESENSTLIYKKLKGVVYVVGQSYTEEFNIAIKEKVK